MQLTPCIAAITADEADIELYTEIANLVGWAVETEIPLEKGVWGLNVSKEEIHCTWRS
jgi:hypothetical protein